MALINTTTRAEFDDKVSKSNKLVLVDFWAEWCGPCHAMAPSLEVIAKDMDDKLDVVKVNIEASSDNGALAGEHEVRSIPNMQIFRGGKLVDQIIGVTPRPVLEDRIKKLLA